MKGKAGSGWTGRVKPEWIDGAPEGENGMNGMGEEEWGGTVEDRGRERRGDTGGRVKGDVRGRESKRTRIAFTTQTTLKFINIFHSFKLSVRICFTLHTKPK